VSRVSNQSIFVVFAENESSRTYASSTLVSFLNCIQEWFEESENVLVLNYIFLDTFPDMFSSLAQKCFMSSINGLTKDSKELQTDFRAIKPISSSLRLPIIRSVVTFFCEHV